MRQIPLTRGFFAIVDDEDFAEVSGHSWRCDAIGYPVTSIRSPDGTDIYTIGLHRFLMGLRYGDPQVVDHKDGDKLNNRRSNLRICSRAGNQQNRGAQRNNKSGFKGVSWHAYSKSWRAQIGFNGKNKYLGAFDDPKLAHEFYCLAADMLHGEFSNHGAVKC